jgi:hypothetical protein
MLRGSTSKLPRVCDGGREGGHPPADELVGEIPVSPHTTRVDF